MSAPFDPSKLNLDITEDSGDQNTPEKNTPTPEQDTTKLAPKDDVLSGSISEKSKTETKAQTPPSIQAKEEDPLASKDVIPKVDTKPEIKTQEAATQVKKESHAAEAHIPKDENKQEAVTKTQEEKKLIDINITSLENIISLIDEKGYDYITIEPSDSEVKIVFKQDNIDKDVRYVKYPVYTNILFKIKQATKLIIEDTGSPQEGKGSVKIGPKVFKISSKTAPGQNGERIWMKAVEDTSAKEKKQVKKTSLSMIFGFLTSILFISLILGGAFIAFIVFNAKTVEDVKFFASLGINLNDINTFISQVVTLIFSILLFICSSALIFSLLKFFLTKKAYKRKKVVYGILSGFLLMITFVTASAWMFIDGKIKSLPNWQEQAYGELKIFDNDLLISDDFTIDQALITNTQNLIGPVDISFDLGNFQTNQERKGLTISKYIWNFGDEQIETFAPRVNKVFEEIGNYEIRISAVGIDLQGEEVTQELSNIPAISISHSIEVQESITNNGGKELRFDANSLSNLGEVKWYIYEPKSEANPLPRYPEWTYRKDGYLFIPEILFFEEAYIGLSIQSGEAENESLDKIIRIDSETASEISGEIVFEPSLENELVYEFSVTNPVTSVGNGFIKTFEWKIEDKTYNSQADLGETETSPSIEHEFTNFGSQEVSVTLTDSAGKSQTLTKTIVVQKKVKLRSPLIIESDGEEVSNLRYEENTHEYFIDEFGIPGTLNFDARLVRPVNILYSLTDVSWDVKSDGNIDGTGKNFSYEVPTEGNHTIDINYTFQHRRDSDDIISLTESVFIEGIKKEAILDLQMEYSSNYAPVNVRFDASKSFIKNDDIVKFIYDYGDGIVEERDAINPGHKYLEAGDYIVKLTVVGKSGKSYSTQKSLILLPPAQGVKISTSLKKAPVGQGIDFSSDESSGQIIEYYWDFGDGNISTQANPSYSYKKAGTYTVELRADFANNNSITDSVEIEIFEE